MDWAEHTLATRRSLRLTQAELAARLGIDATTLSRWERGVVTPRPNQQRALTRLAAAPMVSREAFDHFVASSFQMIIITDLDDRVFEASALARYIVEPRIKGPMVGRHINEFFNGDVLAIMQETLNIASVAQVPHGHALHSGNGETSAIYMTMRYFVEDTGIVTAIIGNDRQRNSDPPFARLVNLQLDNTVRDRVWMATFTPWLLPQDNQTSTAPNL
jgi:transcriptional regulator with XRE-family HTH domain